MSLRASPQTGAAIRLPIKRRKTATHSGGRLLKMTDSVLKEIALTERQGVGPIYCSHRGEGYIPLSTFSAMAATTPGLSA